MASDSRTKYRKCQCCGEKYQSNFFTWNTKKGTYAPNCGICAKTFRLFTSLFYAEIKAKPKREPKPKKAPVVRGPYKTKKLREIATVENNPLWKAWNATPPNHDH